jgi:hypothetical protein
VQIVRCRRKSGNSDLQQTERKAARGTRQLTDEGVKAALNQWPDRISGNKERIDDLKGKRQAAAHRHLTAYLEKRITNKPKEKPDFSQLSLISQGQDS